MKQEIAQAIIAGNFSIFVAFIGFLGAVLAAAIGALASYFLARKTTRDEIRKIHSGFAEKLYDKRIEFYPDLWKIADRIYGPKKKYKTGKEIVQRNQKECLTELRRWKRESGGFMFLSPQSLKSFYELEGRLAKNPEKNDEYSETQLSNIEEARVSFCKALKEDIGIFENAEKEINKI